MYRNIIVSQSSQRYLAPFLPTMQSHSSNIRRLSTLSINSMNPAIKEVEYAVRGPIVAKALAIEEEINAGSDKYNFPDVIKCNIGDAHAMGQKPITFIRQVVSGMINPDLIPSLPSDVQARCNLLLTGCGGSSIGAYSNSAGVQIIREHVAKYIEDRDGFPCDPNNIYLSTGASGGIVQVLKMLTFGEGKGRTGVMIPTPQYPLYSASISEFQAIRVNYYLDEETNWSLKMDELARSYEEAKETCTPRVLCIINPGNPTGNVLTRENIEEIVKFAYEKQLFLMADEVYQDNIYDPNSKFHSFKKVVSELGSPYTDKLQYASFHSVSKGYMGECGFRGGYMELNNWSNDVTEQMNKLLSSRLCPPVTGQAAMSCVVNMPKEGDESYPLWKKERDGVLRDLNQKAKLTAEGFNSIEGVSCQTVQGAMYSFPSITMPEKFVQHCEENGLIPDSVYCIEFLQTKGVCVVPGSGFGQRPGTHHFRMTILPPADKMAEVLRRFSEFHKEFTKKWSQAAESM